MRRTATPVSPSRSAMTGPRVWPSYGLPCRALGCSTNCPPFGGGDRRGNRDLAAELVRRARLAAADTLHLGSMQRIDLWPALMLVLMANPQREIEQRAEAVYEHCVALDLAANVTDDAFGSGGRPGPPRPKELERC